jgi:alkylglycerol monooxygenase
MHLNWLALAIPFFLGFMLLEYLVARKRGLPYFQLHNSIANVSIGIAERLSEVLIAGAFYFVYDYIQKNYGIFEIRPGIFLWVLLFLLTDFVWYWYHRLAHEVNLLWMVHVVHHQSEDFNYTVSARITVFQSLVRTAFWAVLPLLGFPAYMITTMLLIHGLYPFFIHTRLIGKLGVLEYILVTPSHHRVHHASNEEYLDKNYGDVLIIWDKLFGTFRKEGEAPSYGLTQPLKTYSFLWQHFHFAIELWLAVKSTAGFRNKLKLVFGRPDKLQEGLRERAEELFGIRQNKERMHQPLNRYVIWQMAVLLVTLFAFIGLEAYLPAGFKACYTIIAVLTLINCGAIMEQKRWVFQVESLRYAIISFQLLYYVQYPLVKLALVLCSILFLVLYRQLEHKYFHYVYRST